MWRKMIILCIVNNYEMTGEGINERQSYVKNVGEKKNKGKGRRRKKDEQKEMVIMILVKRDEERI